jgi:predicted nucleic acid-binding protein
MTSELSHNSSKYLIDTDVMINHLNVGSKILNSLVVNNEFISISVITEYELYRGVFTENEILELKSGLKFFNKFAVDSDVCFKASEYAKNENLRKALGLADMLIASTCFVNKLILVTENKKHFKMIPDITIYNSSKD